MERREYEASFALEETHWWFRAKRALIHALLTRYGPASGRGLDVGCGTGGTLKTLTSRAAAPVLTWIGLDAEPLALALSQRRGLGRLVGGSATALPFRDGAFDACLCLDLLYHRRVETDGAALAECHRVLRSDGLLVVTDSAFPWLRSAHDAEVHGLRRYTRRQLVERIRAAGFTPLCASYAYCLVFPIVLLVRLAQRVAGKRAPRGSDVFPLPPAANQALLAVQAVERVLFRLAPLPFGSSVVCVARKGGLAAGTRTA